MPKTTVGAAGLNNRLTPGSYWLKDSLIENRAIIVEYVYKYKNFLFYSEIIINIYI